MALSALLFDLDGTLLDSNATHAEAFARTAADFGVPLGRDRFDLEIGKGTDRIVRDVFGDAFEAEHGESFRARLGERVIELASERRIEPFRGAETLVRRAKRDGLKTALVTTAPPEVLDALAESAGTDFRRRVHVVATAQDVSERAPDPVSVAVERLGLPPSACALVGDTVHDGRAARRAGVAFVGVGAGLWNGDDLLEAGARYTVWRLSDLTNDVPFTSDVFAPILANVSPDPDALTADVADALMAEAFVEARAAFEAGDGPVGAVIARSDGTIVARGRDRSETTGDALQHAEVEALHALHLDGGEGEGLVLVTTLEPCTMCFGAATEAKIYAVLYAREAPPNGGAQRLRPPVMPSLPVIHAWPGPADAHRSACLDLIHAAAEREGIWGYFSSLSFHERAPVRSRARPR